MYFVYIIFSFNTGKYYTGSTENLDSRLSHHNGGYNRSTKSGIPWVIVKYFTVNNRTEALKLENKIKKRGAKRFIKDKILFPSIHISTTTMFPSSVAP